MLLRRALGILGRSSRIIQLDPQGCRGAACVAVLVVPRAQVYVVQLLRSGQQRPIHSSFRKHDGDLLRIEEAMKTVWTDRSRVESHQRCNRLRFLEYHEAQKGIVPAKKPLPLAVGGSVHKGLETLLRESSTRAIAEIAQWLPFVEDSAVSDALADFATHRSALALDTTEEASLAAAISPSAAGFDAQLTATALELGMDPGDPALGELLQRQRNSATEFDAWLYAEQSALVEGLVRAYARRRLRPLLEEFEVLEVEREGDWELGELNDGRWYCDNCKAACKAVTGGNPPACFDCACPARYVASAIRFMSRPDALLRSRADNSLYLLSFKTAAA